MSCIAVNLHDVKKEIYRIDLKTPIHGKDGAKQMGQYIDSDTGLPVTEIVLKRRGLYKMERLWVGKDGGRINKESGFKQDDIISIHITQHERPDEMDYTKELFYCKQANTLWIPAAFINVEPNDLVEHYHLVIQFCHD